MGHQRNVERNKHRLPTIAAREQQRVDGTWRVHVARESYRWSTWLMVAGIFLTLVSFFTVLWWTLVKPLDLLRVLGVLCFAGPALGLVWPRVRLGMEHLEWLFFNMLAVGPLTVGLFLWINYALHGPIVTSEHQVSYLGIQGQGQRSYEVECELKDDFLREYPWALSTWSDVLDNRGDTLTVGIAKGAFGVEVVASKEFH
jgi:hypothetical protein